MLCGTHQNQPKLPCFNKNRKAFPTILNLVWQLVNMQQQCCLQTKILNKNTLLNISQKPKNTLINCCLQTYQHKSHDGIKLEVLKRSKSTDQKKPPLIFLHGARRAAWSFEENFLPYFSELGYPSYALSFRGQGGSEAVDGPVAGTIQQHIDDVAHFVQSLKNNQEENLDPVILGHSLGGFIAEVAIFKKPQSISFEEFQFGYSDDMEVGKLQRYYEKIQESTNWPAVFSRDDFRSKIPLSQPENVPPVLVLGALQDIVWSKDQIKETAEWLNVQPVFIDQLGHDCMLDTRWRDAADRISIWLNSLQ
eukprot:TRINITY_DN30106_c0_g1_i5.p1 TRINITY_DN30106_c0_g1~~TRINITY_DN30106_c0_g1_i5.p1  ORF type:complete len:307 (-),score=18.56 TRINITY_DN30106_c0_g1_i5:2491-3411(-)